MGGVGQGGGAAAWGLAGRRSAGGEPLHWASLALYFLFFLFSLLILFSLPFLSYQTVCISTLKMLLFLLSPIPLLELGGNGLSEQLLSA